MNYLIGIAIGCVLAFIGYQFVPSKREREKQKKLTKLTVVERLTIIERKLINLELDVSRNKASINKAEDRLDMMENRQDQADQWFGSVIRHSREQFDKEAIEAFLDEQGLKEEEENGY